MSQRDSGYARVERDRYETPEWASLAVVPHLPANLARIWEPASGTGKMVRALQSLDLDVTGSDIADGADFFAASFDSASAYDAIVTNPPYETAQAFIEQALAFMKPTGVVAMLLRTDFDHAKGRSHLFAHHPAFAKKLVLTKRIVWFERKGAAPSFNHAWYIWDWEHRGSPTIAYYPVTSPGPVQA